MSKVDLSKYNNSWYKPGAAWKRALWFFVNGFFFKTGLFPSSRLKVFLLRSFGAVIGRNGVIRTGVSVKYPWFLTVGDNCWIGENVWIDNLAMVSIGSNSCISQGAFILCGNHNFNTQGFDLKVQPVLIEEGAWVGARAIVCPGAELGSHAMVTAGSVAVGKLDAYWIYQGNPAIKLKERKIPS